MTPPPMTWAAVQPWLLVAAGGAVVLAGLGWAAARARRGGTRPPAAVIAAAVAAAACTAYSADTSWRFAADHLDMNSAAERAAMFAAGEMALFATALMARQNLKTTGAPGTPGILVWLITGVQIIPAYAESGLIGGTVRAFVGPILAAVLWHLAMGIELRHARPGANSRSLPALIARELRERLLSRLGLAVRDRSAEQITRDRWTARAVDLAARLAHRHGGWAWHTARLQRRLSRAVGRAQVGAHPEQRRALLQLLSARLHSGALASLDLPSPWQMREPVSSRRAAPAVACRELREMHPLDAVLAVASAHPDLDAQRLREVLGDHGVVVSDTQVRMAMRLEAPAHPRVLNGASAADQPSFAVHARWHADPGTTTAEAASDAAPPDADAAASDADADRALLPDARRVEAAHQAEHGRPASLRALQSGLRIGQARAQRMRALLDQETQP
ncbi:hypothetical protein QCN29_26875 [Streptomyces sp. HNM0663]|uniref:Integral membrane protein n=1 Tax=Streptomyces chengmaiensis TaxID=3040919 RepID=A0ABT6HUD9_9ACTN|nr:hypothetical protein [Streptomyces chengmaiensis]MDH2392336.1 hypothetical protein [Streptomyces chengmaiensis]